MSFVTVDTLFEVRLAEFARMRFEAHGGLPGRAGGIARWSWVGLKNGALLTQAEDAGFSVFVTGDQNLEFQQNISNRRLGVVVLCATSNALEDLLPLVPAGLTAIATYIWNF